MISSEWTASVAKRITNEAKNVSFLTEILLDDEEIEIMRSNVDEILTKSLKSDNLDVKIVASYLLVDIAKRKYDGSFWPHVSEEAGRTYNAHQGSLYGVFQNALRHIGMKASLEIETKRKLEMILIHTLVPDNEEYMYSFFDFISKYYKKVLDYELPDNFNFHFKELAEFISQSGPEDDIIELGDSFPNPASLNKCTLYALTKPVLFAGLLEKILRIIDAGYKGLRVPQLGITRFAAPFQQWYSKNIGSRSKKSKYEEIRTRRPRLVLRESNDYSVAIIFPERPNCTEDAKVKFAFGSEILVPKKQPRVLTIPGLKFPRTKEDVVYYFKEDLNHSVFENFVLRFDEKDLFRNDTEKKWKIFNEHMNEIKNISPGHVYILFEDEKYDLRTNNSVSMTRIREGLYYVFLKNGETINLMDETYIVTKENEDDLIGFNVECYEGVNAEINGIAYKIAKDLQVLYRASAPEKLLSPVIKITIDSNDPVHIRAQFENIRDTQVFSLPRDSIPDGVHIVEVVLYSGERKIDEDAFVTMPGLKYNFDTEDGVYYKESSGKLRIESPIEEIIEFNTDKEEVFWTMESEDCIIKIQHKIPAIKFSVDGENWVTPGVNEIPIDEFIDDAIRIKCTYPVKLYVNNKPLEYIDRGDYLSFQALEYKGIINENLEKVNAVFFSIMGKPKISFLKFITHNDYVFMNNYTTIQMEKNTKNDAFCRIAVDGNERFLPLSEGDNCLFDKPPDNARIRVIEKREKTECVIIEKYVGNPVFIKRTKNGVVAYHYENYVEFSCEPGDYDKAKNEYSSKKRFNPWMKIAKTEKDILSLFK